MIFKALMIGLLLAYYFYFYFDYSQPVEEPTTAQPKRPLHHYKFFSNTPHHFRFESNNALVWEHTLPDTYTYHARRIIVRDVCFGQADNATVAATGEPLYEYVKAAPPQHSNLIQFSENDEQVVRQRDVFYFRCKHNHINRLEVCPSGQIFFQDHCQDVNMCTGQPDGTLFPHLDSKQYYECQNETGHVRSCGPNEFFIVKNCLSTKDLTYFCRFHGNESFLLDQNKTRVHCERGKPVFQTCPPGRVFFDTDVCELDTCKGAADNTRLPLPETTRGTFKYVPGYMKCTKGKVVEQVECTESFTDEIDEYFLPMIYDPTRQKCVLPQFGINVQSTGQDILMPIREYTLGLRNWELADRYDRMKGRYIDPQGTLRTKILSDGKRIGTHFKEESACDTPTDLVPILRDIKKYYDCSTGTTRSCLNDEFFNGTQCLLYDDQDESVFKYKELPVFKFNLNYENWLEPWNKLYDAIPNFEPPVCKPGSELHSLYNVCTPAECKPYVFLRLIPDMTLLLPEKEKAMCFYDGATNHLIRETFDEPYSYWDQRLLTDPQGEVADCVPGNRLRTGNFIWDHTLYATCLPDQPFVFCPNPLGIQKITDSIYACKPPDGNIPTFHQAGVTHFPRHEVRRITPADPTKTTVKIQRHHTKAEEVLPVGGVEIAENEELELKLVSNDPVKLELRRRVTYPPNVIYEYDDQGKIEWNYRNDFKVGYVMKNNAFPPRGLTFPTHRAHPYLLQLKQKHLRH